MDKSKFNRIRSYFVIVVILILLFGNLIVLRIYFPFKIDSLLEYSEENYKKNEYEIAKKYSLELLSICATYDKINLLPWNHWNYGNAIHNGHTILGLIAFESDDLVSAKNYLVLSGKTPGSPQLDTYGPNMMLAKKILGKGEKEVVLQYFHLCSKFWDDDRKLSFWSDMVKKDLVPAFDKRLLKF